jgi:hypothetical protein
MKNEFISQYAHTWRVFSALVNDFDNEAWLTTGRDATTPARLSFHILKATKFYIEDQSETNFRSGKKFDMDSVQAKEDELPSRKDILESIEYFSKKNQRLAD